MSNVKPDLNEHVAAIVSEYSTQRILDAIATELRHSADVIEGTDSEGAELYRNDAELVGELATKVQW